MTELKRKVTLKHKVAITEPPHEKSNKRWWLWLIPVLVIVVGVVYFYSSSTGGDNIPTNATAEESTTPEAISITDSIASEEGTAQPAEETTSSSPEQPSGTASQSGAKPITPIPYNQGEAYKVYQFPFGDGSYSKPDPELDKLAKVLAENPNVKIQIYAYTDKVGSAEFNQTLSAKRAKVICDYLVSKGIDKGRLSYQGKGISTKYGSDAENRRAEFILK
jgi:outer membrane protein OmpA-like peptidoglycan-associated protein